MKSFKKINLLTSILVLFTFNQVLAQQDSKAEERIRYESKKNSEARIKQSAELKSRYVIELNSNAKEVDFNKAVDDLNESKKFKKVTSEFRTLQIELDCKEAMLPEDIKAIISKSGLGISRYTSK